MKRSVFLKVPGMAGSVGKHPAAPKSIKAISTFVSLTHAKSPSPLLGIPLVLDLRRVLAASQREEVSGNAFQAVEHR